jgi:hypothetical protein
VVDKSVVKDYLVQIANQLYRLKQQMGTDELSWEMN